MLERCNGNPSLPSHIVIHFRFQLIEEGGFNAGRLWKLKKKLSPKVSDPPTAMMNTLGKLITSEEENRAEATKHYKNVFKEREITKDLKDFNREKLCHERLKLASRNKSPEWSVEDVTCVLRSLKTGKYKDPYQLHNDLFKSVFKIMGI